MFTELSLECRALKDVIGKVLKLTIMCKLVGYLTVRFTMSIRQSCKASSLTRTVYFWRDEPVLQVLAELAECYGFKTLLRLLYW